MNDRTFPRGSVRIESVGKEDLPVVADLARTIWRRSFPGMISEAQIEYMLAQRYTRDAMDTAIRSGALIYEVLRIEGEPLAFAAHGPGEATGEWKLFQLYVHPDWQGRGLGGLLMDHVERVASRKGCDRIVLTVNRRNARAIAAYTRRGFQVVGEVNTDIGKGFLMEDYVMVRRFVADSIHPPSSPGPI